MKRRQKYGIVYLIIWSTVFSSACTKTEGRNESERPQEILINVGIDCQRAGYFQDVLMYRAEVLEQVAQNDLLLSVFKGNLERENKSGNSFYVNQISEMEAKNRDLENRILVYSAQDSNGWAKYKDEFNRELNVLNYAFRSLGVSARTVEFN